MTLRHVVMWRMAAEDPRQRAEHAAEGARLLAALEGVVPEIQSLSAGPNAAYPEENWDLVLVADFADQAALERYQVHPAHQEVVAYIRSVVGARAAVDIAL
ncbi:MULTISPECIES: Dabb family protein [unclassified Microbacterium]|uniref:Dabb family protein n=1 Tax=unclassified Microbacterium TaxID=2609290 RepID=UPI0022F09BAE|nr:Dabb family protein [Streptomyces sp. MS2A]